MHHHSQANERCIRHATPLPALLAGAAGQAVLRRWRPSRRSLARKLNSRSRACSYAMPRSSTATCCDIDLPAALPHSPPAAHAIAIERANDHHRGMPRGFLPRGLSDTCPQVCADHGIAACAGRCPTTLNSTRQVHRLTRKETLHEASNLAAGGTPGRGDHRRVGAYLVKLSLLRPR